MLESAVVELVILLYIHPCVSEISAFNMSLLKDIIKGLKEVTRKIEEGGKVDSNTMGIFEEFLKNFPPPTTLARKLSDFPAELLQLIFSYLRLW